MDLLSVKNDLELNKIYKPPQLHTKSLSSSDVFFNPLFVKRGISVPLFIKLKE